VVVVRRWRQFVRVFPLGGIAALLLQPHAALPQTADFQIVWINVGEVAAAPDGRAARAGRQLFMAPDLVQFSLNKITVARVDVEPSVIALKPGEKFCLTSLHVNVNAEDHTEVENAPLSVSVRQDQRERLSMRRAKSDICFKPSTPGEYPVRLNSLLPARDGTTRGAQIFLRVHDDNPDESADESAPPVTQALGLSSGVSSAIQDHRVDVRS
jgi:hypothetical protein